MGGHQKSSASSTSSNSQSSRKKTLADFAKYVPLRLSGDERKLLNVLEHTLKVSEYTDNVDITISRRGLKTQKILDGILEVCHIATGLAVASGHERSLVNACRRKGLTSKLSMLRIRPKNGKKDKKKTEKKSSAAWASREPKENAEFFQTMFEIGRRNKVLNPSQMRTTYGKMMYLLQDAQNPNVAKALGFSLHKDLVLVRPFLEEHECTALLLDPRLEGATEHINDRDSMSGQRIDRKLVEQRVSEKRRLIEELVTEYETKSKLSADDIRLCIDSLSDATAYIETNLTPVRRMLIYLEEEFNPSHPKNGNSLELKGSARLQHYKRFGLSADQSGANEGAKLNHTHSTQFVFVWQTLRLWCKVMRNMHRLWICADDDLLSSTASYHLFNTGQGLNRVQACPKLAKVMRSLLRSTQKETGAQWVGLSVVHLGDRDVPNALVFIDKYTQIPKLLSPIVSFIQGLPDLCKDHRIGNYVEEHFGSPEKLKLKILTDYFKHGFDGSGDDGGSCIDGRLTSSWNWTSRLSKKDYYHIFMMSGFQGFDGIFLS